jgi:hypothetical protein
MCKSLGNVRIGGALSGNTAGSLFAVDSTLRENP